MSFLLLFIGRLLLGGYFLQAGLRNLGKVPMHVGILTEKKVPAPNLALGVALAVQIGGALMVILGLWPALGALGLIGFTIVANALYHDFWNHAGAERTNHLNSVLVNLGLIGGLLLVIAIG
jgi:putative oxidoreductase